MKNILIIGLGRFGKHIAMQLNQMGHEIMAVDLNEERVEKVLPFVTNAQIGDSTDAEFLKSLGIEGDYEGIGHCVLGYADGPAPKAAPRKDSYVYYVK